MAIERLALPDGRVVEARAVGFTSLVEDFNEYVTDDNVLIRVKHVATKILVTDETDADGAPRYVVHSEMVVASSEPSPF
jgi:hypothetical protein